MLTDEQIKRTVADIINLRASHVRAAMGNQLVRYLQYNDVEVEFKDSGEVEWKRKANAEGS